MTMRNILLLLAIQTFHLSSTFDLPQPLDNFYDEVVRFYKRLRHEGGMFGTSHKIHNLSRQENGGILTVRGDLDNCLKDFSLGTNL